MSLDSDTFTRCCSHHNKQIAWWEEEKPKPQARDPGRPKGLYGLRLVIEEGRHHIVKKLVHEVGLHLVHLHR